MITSKLRSFEEIDIGVSDEVLGIEDESNS